MIFWEKNCPWNENSTFYKLYLSDKPSPGTLSTQLLIIQLLTCGAVVQLGIYMYPILQTRSLPEYTCTVLYSLGYIYVPHPPNQVPSWIHMYSTVQLGIYMYPILQTRSLPEYTCTVLHSLVYIYVPQPPKQVSLFLNTYVPYYTAWDIYEPQPPDQVPFWINMYCTVLYSYGYILKSSSHPEYMYWTVQLITLFDTIYPKKII